VKAGGGSRERERHSPGEHGGEETVIFIFINGPWVPVAMASRVLGLQMDGNCKYSE
jgi:hypothetical protein